MFIVLDHDVDIAVARLLRRSGHQCVTAGQAGLATAADERISVFADNKGAVLFTHDKEAIGRRRSNTFGRHVYLACVDWDAVAVVKQHLIEIVRLIETRDAIMLRASKEGVIAYPRAWDWSRSRAALVWR